MQSAVFFKTSYKASKHLINLLVYLICCTLCCHPLHVKLIIIISVRSHLRRKGIVVRTYHQYAA